jgi:predicted RecA/RadA family phage recombinase
MADNFIQSGTNIEVPTATGMDSGDPFVTGTYQPCVLLTDAGAASPYNATVKTEGIFDLSVKAHNGIGNQAIAIGDAVYWHAGDTPKLSCNSARTFFGIALEAVASSETDTIKVRLVSGVQGIGAGQVKQTHLASASTYETFKTAPVCMGTVNTGAVAVGTTGAVNLAAFEKNIFEYHVLGAGQTIVIPTIATDGLLCSLDLTNNEGAEYTQGITARSKSAFVIGTSPAFYLKVGLKVADVSGSDICAVGFRKTQAYNATFVNYTDKATLNKIGGDIYISTALNDAADVDTDTTDDWADGETHMLEVYVSAAGVVTYKIDGAAPTATAAFTFDATDVVVPFFHLLHDATTPGAVHLTHWEVGLQ